MTKKYSNLPLIAALVALAFFSAHQPADAATSAIFSNLAVGDSTTLQLDRFDDSGGTFILTGVTIRLLNVTMSADVMATNDEPTIQDISVNLVGGMVSATPQINLGIPSTNAGFNASGGPQSINPGQTFDFGTLSGGPTTVEATATAPPTDLSAFIGPGTFDIEIGSTGGWAFSGGGDATLTISDFDANGTVQVEYSFVVPEPSRALLACFGLIGAGLVRRRPACASTES